MLKAILDSIEELDEPLKEHYRPGTEDEGLDGKFVLDVGAEGGLALENVDGLKSTLGSKKTEVEQLKAKVAAFGDLDPAQAKAAIAKVAELGDLDPESEADKIAEQKVAAIKEQMAEQHKTEVQALETRLAGRDALLSKVLVEDQALKAISAEGGDVDLLLPHVMPAIRLKIEEADDGSVSPIVTIIDKDGNPRIGDSAGKDMDVGQLVQTMKTEDKFARLFDSSGHSGSGNDDEGGGGGSGERPDGAPSTWTRRQKIDYVKKHGQEKFNDLAAAEG